MLENIFEEWKKFNLSKIIITKTKKTQTTTKRLEINPVEYLFIKKSILCVVLQSSQSDFLTISDVKCIQKTEIRNFSFRFVSIT